MTDEQYEEVIKIGMAYLTDYFPKLLREQAQLRKRYIDDSHLEVHVPEDAPALLEDGRVLGLPIVISSRVDAPTVVKA